MLNFTNSFLLELLKDCKTSRFKTSVEICSLKIKITVSKSTFISLQEKLMDCKVFGIYYTYFPVTVTVIQLWIYIICDFSTISLFTKQVLLRPNWLCLSFYEVGTLVLS